MNGCDALLGWLADRGSTPWQRVRKACQGIAIARGEALADSAAQLAYRWADPLLRLGHAEFDAIDRSVIACPAGIAWDDSRDRGVLYGFWSVEQLRQIHRYGEWLSRLRPQVGPTCRIVYGDKATVSLGCQEVDAWCEHEPSEWLLQRLPVVADLTTRLKPDTSAIAGVWERYACGENGSEWLVESPSGGAPGLYRRRQGRRERLLVTPDGRRLTVSSLEEQRALCWLFSSRQPWLHFEDQSSLLIPCNAPQVPTLIARALTAATGLMATRESHGGQRYWRYADVKLENANRAARILNSSVLKEDIS